MLSTQHYVNPEDLNSVSSVSIVSKWCVRGCVQGVDSELKERLCLHVGFLTYTSTHSTLGSPTLTLSVQVLSSS